MGSAASTKPRFTDRFTADLHSYVWASDLSLLDLECIFVRKRSRVKPLLQSAAAECGPACVVMLLQHHGRSVDLQTIRREHDVSLRGASLRDILQMLERHGVAARPMRVGLTRLEAVALPCILHWNFDHFVVLESYAPDNTVIIDPAAGRRRVLVDEFSASYTGVLVEVIEVNAAVAPSLPSNKLTLRAMLPHSAVVRDPVVQVLATTLALNAAVLSVPLFLAALLGRIVPSGSHGLLITAALAFAALVLLQGVTRLIRAFALTEFKRLISDGMTSLVFDKLIWLNTSVIERRSAGTIATNYRSIFALSDLLSEELLAAVVDSLSAIAIVVILFWCDLLLGAIALTFFVAYITVVLYWNRKAKPLLRESLAFEAREGGFFVESITRLSTIRVFQAERWRTISFHNVHSQLEDARQRHADFVNIVQAFGETILQMAWIVVLVFAGYRAMQGEIGVPMLAAVVVWLGLATSRIRDIVARFSQMDSIDVHVDRIADIVVNQSDRPGSPNPTPLAISGSIGCRNLCFRYSPSSTWVVDQISFNAPVGQWTTIIGASGEGKSTLVKLLAGLLIQDDGAIQIDGADITSEMAVALRRVTGVVLQNDGLFAGSIRDNVTMFDFTPDIPLVEHCLALACMDQDVAAMPMKLDSLVGEQGGGLSAGQLQRLMLARALYRKPQLLLLDEFTANLDEENEARIVDNLMSTGITIIAIAHRPQVIAAAHRAYIFRDRCLTLFDRGHDHQNIIYPSLVAS
jgi:ATP-binding cassette, subfamily B, bacterial CvaB/MchF/RaxB